MDICEICKKPLNKCATTWVAGGKLFCSDLCCARYLLAVYAEEVNTQDIGIPYRDPAPTEIHTVHKANKVSHMPMAGAAPDLYPMYDDKYVDIREKISTREETIILREES